MFIVIKKSFPFVLKKKKRQIITRIFLFCLVLSVLSLSVFMCPLYLFDLIFVCTFHLCVWFPLIKILNIIFMFPNCVTLVTNYIIMHHFLYYILNICPLYLFYFFVFFVIFLFTYIQTWLLVQIICEKRRAMRNLVVSITYPEWRGHHYELLLLLVHHSRPMRPRDNCAAVVPLSRPFCSRMDARVWRIFLKSAIYQLWPDHTKKPCK